MSREYGSASNKFIHIMLALCSTLSLGFIFFTNFQQTSLDAGSRHGDIFTYLSPSESDQISTENQSDPAASTPVHVPIPAPAPVHVPLDLWDELDVLSGGRDAKNMECPPPLVRFENIIVKPDRDLGQNATQPATTMAKTNPDLIPKILHFSMRSRCMPQDLARILDRWREVLPNYSIFFHDDDAVDRLMDLDWLEFPNYHDAMKCILSKGAMKIDVWRVLLLYKYGGVYSDIDNWPLASFNETTIRTDLSAFFFNDAYDRPSQWFMAAEPRHPIMHGSMHHIIKNLLNMKSLWRPKVVFITGPNAVKDGYFDFLHRHCCNGTVTQKDLIKNDVVLTGTLQKKVLKKNSRKFITNKYGYKDIVAWNSTLNVTRGERIEKEGGVVPWPKANYKSQTKVQNSGVSRRMTCRQYIEKVKEGSLEEIKQW